MTMSDTSQTAYRQSTDTMSLVVAAVVPDHDCLNVISELLPIAASVAGTLSQLPALLIEQLGPSENAPKLEGEDKYCTVNVMVTPLLSRTTACRFLSVQACLTMAVVPLVALVPTVALVFRPAPEG